MSKGIRVLTGGRQIIVAKGAVTPVQSSATCGGGTCQLTCTVPAKPGPGVGDQVGA